MKTTIRSIVTICSLFFFVVPASAADIDFTPRISVSEEYSDNIDLDPSDEKDDFITTVTPGFSLDIDARSSGLTLSYDAGYSFYDEYDEYDSWRHSASAMGWAELSRRTRLEITDTFLYTEDPGDEDDEDFTIRRDRNVYYTNSAGVSLTHQFGENDMLKLGYVYSILENDDETLEDNSRHTPSASLTWWMVPNRWRFDTGVEYTRGEFSGSSEVDVVSDDLDEWIGSIRLTRVVNRDLEVFAGYRHTLLDYDGDEVDYQVYEPSVGFTYTWGEGADLSLSVGYFTQDRDEGDDESGVTVNGDLAKTWRFRRSSIRLAGYSGYENSAFGAENLGFDEYYGAEASARHEFSRHITGDVFSSYRRDKYTDPDDDREDKTTRAGVGLSARLARWLVARLGYTYTDLNSDDSEDEYTENSVILTFTLAPSSPI